MYGRGKAANVLRFTALYTVLLPLGFLIGVHFGVLGVVAAWLIIYPVIYVFFVRACLDELSVSWGRFWNAVQPGLIASLVMVVAVRMVHPAAAGVSPLDRLIWKF